MSFPPESFYLDDNASAPLRHEARVKIEQVLQKTGNASSVHRFGRSARAYIEEAREKIAANCEAKTENIVFTSSGSEANALALHDKSRFLCSASEHASVLAWQPQGRQGEQRQVPLLPTGVVDLLALTKMLDASTTRFQTVSVMAANNETGVVQPIEKIAEICHARTTPLHCDATQAAGRLSISLEAWGADMLTFSAHKIGGPKGVGALVCTTKARERLVPLLRGGGQEGGLRAGTENVAAIAGFATALDLACKEMTRMQELKGKRDAFEKKLKARLQGLRVVGSETLRLANTSCFIHPRLSAELLLMLCDSEGIAISSGAACSSGKVAPSHVLRAMGFDEDACRRAVRISFGLRTPEGALDALLDLLSHKEKEQREKGQREKKQAGAAA